MQIPIIGDIPTATWLGPSMSILCGYIIGSNLRTSIRLILILVVAALVFGLISPESAKGMVSLYATFKPLLDDALAKFGGNVEPTMIGFCMGTAVGLWKG